MTFKEKMQQNREKFKKLPLATRIIINWVLPIFLVVIIVFGEFLFPFACKPQEYKVYKYAIECVEDNLRYPETAKLSSFAKSEIEKTFILNPTYFHAWEVTITGTAQNGLGIKGPIHYELVIYEDEYGDFECYQIESR